MKILIDTHIFLWMLSSPEKLSKKRRFELESSANEIFLSSMSIAELMIKSQLGKIDIDFNPLELSKELQLQILDFTGMHAMMMGQLPFHHKDPFDRMIISQAISNNLKLMSDDKKFIHYDCKII